MSGWVTGAGLRGSAATIARDLNAFRVTKSSSFALLWWDSRMHSRIVARGKQLAVLPLWVTFDLRCRGRHRGRGDLFSYHTRRSRPEAQAPDVRLAAHETAGRAIDARYFEPGACMSYPPTAGNRHLTVFLDAGHGGIDPGALVPPSRVRPSRRPT